MLRKLWPQRFNEKTPKNRVRRVRIRGRRTQRNNETKTYTAPKIPGDERSRKRQRMGAKAKRQRCRMASQNGRETKRMGSQAGRTRGMGKENPRNHSRAGAALEIHFRQTRLGKCSRWQKTSLRNGNVGLKFRRREQSKRKYLARSPKRRD